MPDLRPLLAPDSVVIVGAAADDSLRGRLTKQLVEHGYPGRVYPVTRSQKEVLGHQAYATVAEIPEAADLAVILVPAAHVVSTIEQCGARGIRAAVVISSGFAEEKTDAAAARDTALRDIAKRTGMVIAGPNSEGLVNPLRPLVATFSPVFHDHTVPLLPEGSRARPIAVTCQSGALTYAFLSRGRDRQLQLHLPDQRRQPDRARSPRLCRLGARRRWRRHLHVLSRRHSRSGTIPRRRRQGGPRRQADDRREGRALRRRPPRRRLAYRRAGACRIGRRRDLPPSRHHPRRGSRPHGRCRDRLRLLQAAAREPGRDHHRLRRQRGVDGRHSVGARSRTAGARRRHPAPADGDAAVLRVGAEPDRRDGAGDRRGRLRADGRAGAPVRADRHDPADQLAGQREPRQKDGRRAGADHRDAGQADPDGDLHDRDPGRDRDVGRRRHRLLHLDAELRPRDPCARSITAHSANASPAATPSRLRRRCNATRSRALCRCPARS